MQAFDTGAFRVLAVDDNEYVLSVVSQALMQAGFVVTTATSGEDGLQSIQRMGLPHLALVDIGMPYGMDGIAFCEAIHEFSDVPVIMLTAIDEEATIVEAIEHHAEDYVTKPFSPSELVARVRRVLRRIGSFAYTLDPITEVDDRLKVDFAHQQAYVCGTQVPLTPTETKLLYILMRNSGQVITTDFIIRRLWPFESAFEDRLRVYVHRLRRKIEGKTKSHRYISSVRGVGYRFVHVETKSQSNE